MKVKFANGVVKNCIAPTEQKVFKTVGGTSGWILNLRLIGKFTSTELDNLIALENIVSLEFLSETENGEDKLLFTLDGYEKVTSSVIRHAEDIASTTVEIQLTKGL
jgi:hypothetical protein